MLEKKNTDLAPSDGKTTLKVPKKDTLQNIIDKVNERFDGTVTSEDANIVANIYRMFMNDDEIKKFRHYAKDTTPEMFSESLFPDKFKELATQCWLNNSDAYKKLFNDPEFYSSVMTTMAKELYKILRQD